MKKEKKKNKKVIPAPVPVLSKKEIRDEKIIKWLQYALMAIIFMGAGSVWTLAAIRITDDPKPKRWMLKLKNCETGAISTKYESEDMTFPDEIGDFIEESQEMNKGGAVAYTMLKKYVIIDKKRVNEETEHRRRNVF